jgi:hypothetical protein
MSANILSEKVMGNGDEALMNTKGAGAEQAEESKSKASSQDIPLSE